MTNSEIILEYPFSDRWEKGYIVKDRGRNKVILYNTDSDRSSTLYSRYLMSVNLKRFLNKNEVVDHIDNDKTNDCITNLQILSDAENIRKTHCKPLVELRCPICKISFTKTRTQLRGKLDRAENNNIACSRKCGYSLGVLTKKGQ